MPATTRIEMNILATGTTLTTMLVRTETTTPGRDAD